MTPAAGHHRIEAFAPSTWQVRALGDLASTVASGRSSVGGAHGTYPVHGSTNVIGYCEEPEYGGDAILVARVGANAGKLRMVSGRYGVTDNTIILRLKNGCHLAYFWRQLESKNLNGLVFGSGQPLLTGSQLKALPVFEPPLEEQRAIADTVSRVDATLECLDALIAKKSDVKKAVIQQLLTGRRRLAGFKTSWQSKSLSALGRFLKGSGVRKDESLSGEIPCVRYGEIYTHHNDYVKSFPTRISPAVAETATKLRKGDILFAASGETKAEIGKCAAYVHEAGAYAGGDIIILRPYEADPVFLGYYLNTPYVQSQKANRGQGDAVVHITKSALAAIEVQLPSPDEQSAIASVLVDMDADLAALEARREKTAALKQAMLQQLLTGRIRLI